jgi:excisionase family DNA binding protein
MTTDTIIPTEQDALLARESGERLAALISKPRTSRDGSLRLRVPNASNTETELDLPQPAVRILLDALKEMGQGNGVSLTSVQSELTTQQAADYLRVSRPFLIEELLEKGKIPFRKVGNRRRLRFADLLAYRQAEDAEIARRSRAVMELMAETERLGLYEPAKPNS